MENSFDDQALSLGIDEIWRGYQPATAGHPLLNGKPPYRARISKDGRKAYAMHDTSGNLRCIALVDDDGEVTFLPDDAKSCGAYLALGKPCGFIGVSASIVDGLLLREIGMKKVDDWPTAITFNRDNLEHVAMAVHKKFPAKKIVVFGSHPDDFDYVLQAARAVGGLMVAISSTLGGLVFGDFADFRGIAGGDHEKE